MGKKTKSKDRLDKFYRFAKEQGYRSRAAFKLIQLNKKHNFLEKATILVDLCAAPGGWLQVASRHMSSASIIVGVDLDHIKPIANVKTFVADITTQHCLDLIKGEIKHLKADVVLNDGAPNVGADWNMDAYSQSELVMHSLKLATQVLKKGGFFITKIFRSSDYLNLIWLFNKFFDQVDASKPEASRTQSAEIFVVCSKYKSPDYIDPKFFEPKWVFKNTEGDFLKEMNDNNVNSIKKVFEKVRRPLLKDDAPTNLFKKLPIAKFIQAENPYFIFSEYNAFDISNPFIENDASNETPQKLSDLVSYPDDFEEMATDLKLLSKSQVGSLIKWRAKVIQTLRVKKAKNSKKAIALQENEADLSIVSVEKGDQEYKEMQKEERTKDKLKEKQMYKYVKSKLVTNNEVVGQDNEGELADFEFGKYQNQVRKGTYIDVKKEEELENEQQQEKKKKLNSYAEMCDNIEYLYEQKLKKEIEKSGVNPEDNKHIVSEILNKKIKKNKKDESAKLKKSDKKSSHTISQPVTVDFDKLKAGNKWFDNDVFNVIANQENKNEANPIGKINVKQDPLNENKTKKEKEDDDSDDDDSDEDAPQYDDLEGEKGPDFAKMNDDDLAEMIVLSKKMLRKKTRREIIDSSYNRYNYPDNPADLPKWFADDEKKHSGIIPQITKIEVQAEKERLYLLKNKLPKKVAEAKYRKKKKVVREMKKADGEVKQLFEEENLNFSKAKQISEIYKKAIRKSKEKPKNIVFMKKQFSGAPRKKTGRKFMVVDKRGKKDLRNKKFKVKGHN